MNLDKLLKKEADLQKKDKKASKRPKVRPNIGSTTLDLDALIKEDQNRKKISSIQLETRLRMIARRKQWYRNRQSLIKSALIMLLRSKAWNSATEILKYQHKP